MYIDSRRIRLERQKRAWSQEHLAEVSGLGLRTVQRIEASGSASYESAKSICASLDIRLSELIVEHAQESVSPTIRPKVRTLAGLIVAIIVGSGTLFLGAGSFADQIMLDIGITVNDQPEQTGHLLTRDGKDAEMRLDEVLRFVVAPMVQEDGRVMLNTKVYVYIDDTFKLASEPKLLVKNNNEAEIRMTMDNGDHVRFQVTPRAD